jgi:hypothetical protein
MTNFDDDLAGMIKGYRAVWARITDGRIAKTRKPRPKKPGYTKTQKAVRDAAKAMGIPTAGRDSLPKTTQAWKGEDRI